MTKKINILDSSLNVSHDVVMRALASSRSALILTDYNLPDNPIIYSNEAFLDLTGYTSEDIMGKNCRFLQGEDTSPDAISQLREAVRGGTDVRVTLKNYRKDGTAFWNDLVMSPIKDDDGTITHFMGMQFDVTDLIESQQNLLSRTEQLERTNHELEQFSYAASHDLQEPLRMISSYLQLLSQRYSSIIDDDGKTFIGYATEGAERMQKLIDDLLMLSRVTSTHQLAVTIDLAETIERARFNLDKSISDTDAQIIVEAMPTMFVNPTQITQLFQNLVSNALKYRKPAQRPVIKITAREHPKDWEISVSDNGIGISPKDLKRVFIIFQRLHTNTEYPGTGVGLAICERIIEQHSGRIWVESSKGNGATVKFTLPKDVT